MSESITKGHEKLADKPAVGSNFGFITAEQIDDSSRQLTYIAAISEALREAMASDPNVLMMGEDIAGSFGGAFKVTKGLEEEFGARRVLNMPMCEAAFVGAATGMALMRRLCGADDELRERRYAATKTATPGQLVLMLFDGALRFLDKALVGFDLDDPLDSNLAINNNILKAQEILRELNVSLNMEKGGEFATTMRRLYNYYDLQLSQSNLRKDPSGVELVIRLLSVIRGAWAEMLTGNSANTVDLQVEHQLQAA